MARGGVAGGEAAACDAAWRGETRGEVATAEAGGIEAAGEG